MRTKLVTVSVLCMALSASGTSAANVTFHAPTVRAATTAEITGGVPAGSIVNEYFLSSTADILRIGDVIWTPTGFGGSLYQHGIGSDNEPPSPAFVAAFPALGCDSWITTPSPATAIAGGGFQNDLSSWFDTSNDGPVNNFRFARLTTLPGMTGRFSGIVAVAGATGPEHFPFIFDITPLPDPPPCPKTVKLTASDAGPNDQFGWSVDISGDTAVIGALTDNGNAGSAYVFIRTGASWTQQAKLIASDAAPNDLFGFTVDVDGDTAVIGALSDNGGAGSAYVFVRSGTSWTQQQKLAPTGPVAADAAFGESVSISGNTAVVGASSNDDIPFNSGAAFVFTRSGTTWTQQQKLLALDAAGGDLFGRSVALAGDTALIGATGNDDGGSNSGSAYVFIRSGTTWTQQAKLLAADDAAGDGFGNAVSLSGDTALIGAKDDDNAGASSGSANVFVRSGTVWTQQGILTALDANGSDLFGQSVSIDGAFAVIGSIGDDDGGNSSGSAYLFARNGATWTQRSKFTAFDAGELDQFGFSVAISGNTILSGAFGNDDAGSNSGSAYVFEPNGCGGEMNCDYAFDVLDVPSFVLALLDPTAYAQQFDGCDPLNGDMNHDPALDGRDIGLFVNCLINGGCQ